ncbi:pseudouridine synthase [Williamsoniiplasma lucivorax]|uniref:Ribosomal large subunit pseudouridine synthase B n=1 Tax=Williamsoniiplasma lucivorax TaxID=209274 RepID=A0A2S5RD54_9MOLU|nr:pseudouridine synthase [Williamsoniiplasma lucivorax]PPE05279.1 ribosomal large subunit pseudouridine synthase B [Williamsoniiplasma lucivorax]
MSTKQERLQKVIANRGGASRRATEKLIAAGQVKVNGIVITELGTKVDVDAKIEINGQEMLNNKEKYYFLFNKPRRVISTMYDPKKRKIVADFFQDVDARVYPVGRLDYDVSGLLIMTNDGDFANFVMHPRYEFLKTYQALCDGVVSKHQIRSLLNGVIIDEDYKTSAVLAKMANYNKERNQSIIELTIAEGKKHHVKKMLAAAEINLLKLKRTQIEFLTDEGLEVGAYRKLTPHEVKRFYGIYHSVKRKGD